MPLILALEMPHITTIIIMAVGVLLLLALAFCLLMLIVFTGSASGAKKKLMKLEPDSKILNPKSTAAPEKKNEKDNKPNKK